MSTGVPAVNTPYPFVGYGIAVLTTDAMLQAQFRSEVAGSVVNIQQDAYMILTKIG